MARYYFHIRTGDQLVEDDEGVELPNVAAVQQEARNAAREMIAELVMGGEQIAAQRFEIVDESGDIVAVLPFGFMVLD
ncbi:hypothetical protein HGP14_34760 [Rhizobium sp. P32RR-XVIII]|uniref:DUF6894 family protein n=1 Tax=Rhizobium sp. P32RR-XVIII TaxID=2726738 RepID=UPI001456F18B|nr:hypothetical protein [Rhizobium sp. P32RR-XVIII]NLS07165.1 hypothetical protein [Rhizobium sp. P32RR-XVIII]NLS08342.1 hypothetical protein [Rhizobium sp. P32RR-XVIII]